jgi:small subunit ribosomal protein S6
MKAYEVMLIIDPSLDDDARIAVIDKAKGVITAAGGTVDSEDPWGKRRLAFEIDHKTEGDYTVVQFHSDASNIAELDRVLHITDPVIRYMIVRREDID